jgi:hypothetical protein
MKLIIDVNKNSAYHWPSPEGITVNIMELLYITKFLCDTAVTTSAPQKHVNGNYFVMLCVCLLMMANNAQKVQFTYSHYISYN